MRKIGILVVAFSLWVGGLPLSAQTKSAAAKTKKEQGASPLLTKVLDNLRSLKTMQVNFSIQVEEPSGKTLATQRGTAQVKGNSYQIKLGDQEIYTDGTLIWTYNKAFKEVQLDNYSQKAGALDITSLFNGKLDLTMFSSKINGEKKATGGAKLKEIELVPVDKASTYFKVVLWVDGRYTIKEAKVFDKNGSRYIYRTERLIKNPTLPKNFGKFEAAEHAGVEVVDIR